MLLKDKVAVITGGAGINGLGFATAKMMAAQGARVAILDLARAEPRAAAERLGPGHIGVVADVTDKVSCAAATAEVLRGLGRIDILVNNAAIIRDEMMGRTKFWEEPINVIDTLDVGLRSSYVATVYAAPLMVPHGKGLVAFTSSSGAVHYAFGPAYGVPKAGVDKMAADMAYDFRDVGIAAVSIWMGSLLTDRVRAIIASKPNKFGHILDTAETPELTGHVIWALSQDPDVMAVSGQTLIGAELAVKYGIKDEGGRQPPSYRDLFDVHPPAQCTHVMR